MPPAVPPVWLTLLVMSPKRRHLPPALLATLLCGALLSACSSAPGPQVTADAYLAAWARQDWAAMQKLTSRPPADFTSVNQAAFRDLTVRQASFTAGAMHAGQSAASAPVTERLTLAGLGTITIRSVLHLVLSQGTWLVKWSPATIAPPLRAGDQLSLRTAWPTRAAVLGAHGTPLTSQGPVVTVGVEGARIKNAAALKSALVTAGAPAAAADTAIAAAKIHPTYFEPVFTVSRARYTQLEPTLYPLPGTVFQASTALSSLTPGLSDGVVGTTGPVTAEELGRLGAPYTARDAVGQTGLEQADERQLAGAPGATVSVVSSSGAHVATLATLAPHPGSPVTTTIEPSVQRAAESALAEEKKSAALVAVSASTGAVLAAVSVNSGGFDQAIDGGFPPGSTFKVITSTALIGHGLTPRSAASCPGTATVDGEVFHNAESEAPVSNLLQAFTESCNTAFIRLATRHLSPSDFPAAAQLLGLDSKPHIGLTAFGGSVPQPNDEADLAATSIGQGRVLVSPLAMAMVAAAADTGTVRAPQLVTSVLDGPGAAITGSPVRQLPASVVSDLHEMMASVVTRGTAAGQGLPAGTYAKTGTAQYGTTKPLKLDAWLMGFKGDIAFAALVVNSAGNGGPTCGPIVAKFLSGL
jgi:Penicillin binding protein transpeptidase domain/Penicillin-binding Protein dimerisation domain/NTF2-like N-terminal transpeptidase domain